MKVSINDWSKADKPKRNEPEQPACALANATIVVGFERIENQKTHTQKQPNSLDSFELGSALQHPEERNKKNRCQAKDAVVAQEEVEQIEPLRFVGRINATRGAPVTSFVLVVIGVEVEIVGEEATC